MKYTLEEMFELVDFAPFMNTLRKTLEGEHIFLVGEVLDEFERSMFNKLGEDVTLDFCNNEDFIYTYIGIICESRFIEMELRNRALIKSGSQRAANLDEAYFIKLGCETPKKAREFTINKLTETLERYEAYRASLS